MSTNSFLFEMLVFFIKFLINKGDSVIKKEYFFESLFEAI